MQQIVYPTGATVTYTWGTNSQSEGIYSTWIYATCVTLGGGGCAYYAIQYICDARFDTPVVKSRTVSVGGQAVEEQDFDYSTVWPQSGGPMPYRWLSKQTTVTTHDLVSGTGFKTVYSYMPLYMGSVVSTPNYQLNEVPVENAVAYYDTDGTLLKTVGKTWGQYNPYELTEQTETPAGGQTAKTDYAYGSLYQVTEKDDYDYGASAPARITANSYRSFALNPILPWTPAAGYFIEPSSEIVCSGAAGAGNCTSNSADRESELDLYYDQTAVSNVSAVGHDDGAFDVTFNKRGNATTAIRRCFPNCPDVTTTYTYDETGQPLAMADSAMHWTTYSFTDNPVGANSAGNSNAYLTSVARPAANGVNHVTSFAYDYASGNLTGATDENGKVTSYTYNDPLGRLTGVVYPAEGLGQTGQQTIAYTYDDAGPNPAVTTTSLVDAATAMVKVERMDGLYHPIQTQLRSDPQGTDYVDTTYDGLGRVASRSNPYRSTGDATYGVTTFQYDALGRKTRQTSPDQVGSMWLYAANTVDFHDGDWSEFKFTYDGFGRLAQVLENDSQGSHALDMETDYQYDAQDDLTSVSQLGISPEVPRVRSFVYDSLSRLTSATNPETGTTAYSYANADGSLCSGDPSSVCGRTDARGIRTNYVYNDPLNRLTEKSYANVPANEQTPTLDYFYDVSDEAPVAGENNYIGHLTGVQSSIGSTVLSTWVTGDYDAMGRSLGFGDCYGETNADCAAQTGISVDYNLAGQIIGYVGSVCPDPNCNVWTTSAYYSYNAAGRMTTAMAKTWDSTGTELDATLFSSPAYNAAGELTSANLAIDPQTHTPGISLTRSYDNLLRVIGETDQGAQQQPIYSYTVAHDPVGFVTHFTDSVMGDWDVWGDSLHRLEYGYANSGPYTGLEYQYLYDSFGNPTGKAFWGNANVPVPSGGSPIYNAKNQDVSLIYDADGDAIDDGLNRYLYDAEGRICAVQPYNPVLGNTVAYLYDGEGNRIAKGTVRTFSCDMTQNGFAATNYYTQNLGGEQILETDGNFNFIHANQYLEDRLLATYSGSTLAETNWHYALNDWVGTRRVQANANGTVEASFQTMPYGDDLVETNGPGVTENEFTGKVRDQESGNDYFGARYYASTMGRFMSPDPAGVRAVKLANPQTWNLYAYTLNDPLRYTDPTGMYTCSDDHNKCATAQDKAFETARQSDLNSKNKAVAAAAAAYGDPTKNNYVAVQFTDAKNGETSAQYSTNGKTLSYSITVSIPKMASGTILNGLVGHEGTHTEQDLAYFGSFKPGVGFNSALDLTHYAAENGAYHNQAAVWQLSGQPWTMNGRGQFLIAPSSGPTQVSNTINQFLADPANGYGGLTPQNSGGLIFNPQ